MSNQTLSQTTSDADNNAAALHRLIGILSMLSYCDTLSQLWASVVGLYGSDIRETEAATLSAYWETVTLIRNMSDLLMTFPPTLKVSPPIGKQPISIDEYRQMTFDQDGDE
jgi:uncharacterized membrane protein YkgB